MNRNSTLCMCLFFTGQKTDMCESKPFKNELVQLVQSNMTEHCPKKFHLLKFMANLKSLIITDQQL